MWLFFALIVTVGGQHQPTFYITHLDGPVSGIDPHYMNKLSVPEPGRRSALFQPFRTSEQLEYNSFIHETEEIKCLPKLTVHTVSNYLQFKEFANSGFHSSSHVKCEAPFLREYDHVSCDTNNNRQHRDMLQFFTTTDGEVLFVSAECRTHTVRLSLFEPPIFTSSFERALVSLYKAALNPALETSNRTLSEFIWSYGTHFSRQTHLGAKVVFGKQFLKRAATNSEAATRRQCMQDAAYKVLTPGERRNNETTLTHFVRVSSEICGEGELDVMATVTGPLPKDNLQDWALIAEELPDPIFYYLEPLSTLFTRHWFDKKVALPALDPAGSHIIGSVLQQYLYEKLTNYCSRIACGESSQSALRGWEINSRCQPGTECLNEPNIESGFRCVPKTGPVLMMGGSTGKRGSAGYFSSGDAIDTGALPNLPYAVYGSSLSAAGTKIYSCGGYRHSVGKTTSCYALDKASNSPQWESISSLPTSMASHTAVTIKDHIWIVNFGKLYDLNTSTNKFHTFHLPLTVTQGHCAVSNDSHSFIIGAGYLDDEIWVNTEEYNFAKWHKVGTLRERRSYSGCVWFEQLVFITGGWKSRNDAVVFDTMTHTIRSAGTLVQGRRHHGMMMLGGKPAVVGGYDGELPIDSIETYDEKTGLWRTSDLKLKDARYHFGLLQLCG